jgi:hypothetical protein
LKTQGKSKSTDLPKVTLAKAKQDCSNRSAADSVAARLGTLRMTSNRRERVILNQKEILIKEKDRVSFFGEPTSVNTDSNPFKPAETKKVKSATMLGSHPAENYRQITHVLSENNSESPNIGSLSQDVHKITRQS